MHRPSPLPLPMAQLIASDAPLLSPTGDSSYQQALFSPTNDSFSYNYYIPPSPPNSIGSAVADSPTPPERVLKMRITANNNSNSQDMCIPTHKLFETHEVHQPQTPSSPSFEHSSSKPLANVEEQRPAVAIKPSAAALKRSASPTPSTSRKRSVGERISTKDFIPPDVSGLSKREARLVKNRAAAFLSRQRKREEFESMEIRVAELEQENAKLLAMTQMTESFSHPNSQSENELASEVEMLRAQLANAQRRELELSQELASKSTSRDPRVKIEAVEPTYPLSSPRSQSPHKSAASLGLMVLLCALPTLLSMPSQNSFSTSFSLPTAFPASSSSPDFNSLFPPNFDWSQTLDTDERGRISSFPQKLEFSNPGLSRALSGLDISFDAVPQEDGKIRVRIHPSSSASSRAGSPGLANSVSSSDGHGALGLDLWGLSDSDNPTLHPFASDPSYYGGASSSFTAYSPSSSNGDPFLGVGGPSHSDFGGLSPFSSTSSFGSGDMDYDFGRISDYSPSLSGSDNLSGVKRRVRIALKSLPATGGEGGEWEVQLC